MRLLEHFKELTIHPKNAEELKGLILQLAIQGKLTKKWRESRKFSGTDVEPASVLLEKIEEEKEKLIKEKKIKKINLSKVVEEDEIPFIIPTSWSWCRLGDVTDLPYGKGLSKKELTEDGYDVFGANGIIGKYSRYLYEEEMLLISCRGAYSGKTNISPKKCFITSNSLVCEFFRPDLTDYNFFYYAITALPKNKIVSGSAQPQVTATNALPLPISLPPLEEQKAIVSIVNQLFKEVEELELQTKARVQLKEDYVTSALQQLANGETAKEWNTLQKHFHTFFTEQTAVKKLRESILQLAVQGKLTAKWREKQKADVTLSARLPDGQGVEVQTAADLLEKIKAEKVQLIKEGKIRKEKPFPEIADEEVPYELPEGWEWCRLGDLGSFINGDRGKNYPNKSEYVDEGIAWINTGHINPDGTLSESRMNFITKDKFDSLRSGKIQDGDLVYCLRGATFGKTAFVAPFSKGAIASSLMIIRSFLKSNREFIYRFLISVEGRKQLLRFDNGSAQPNLSANKVKLYVFPLPPLKEQKAIVSKINTLMALCDKLEKEIEENTQNVEQLMQSCLRDVFEPIKT